MQYYDNILKHPIPQGGGGRNLTDAEVSALKAQGVTHAKRSWHVVRRYFDVDGIGLIYSQHPVRDGGGLDAENIQVSD